MENINEIKKSKIIVILGPTSSGKSDVAIKLAQRFNGEVISADSRQIYRGMDIGTGKVARDFSSSNSKLKIKNLKLNKKLTSYFSEGIAHHMIDIASPRTDYNASKFKKKAEKAIQSILKKGKLPIICGGTGFWIKAVVDNINFPEVKPDFDLRKKLEKEKAETLFRELEKFDPERAKNIDPKNKVRLIRAIEICKKIGRVPKIRSQSTDYSSRFEFLQIGISVPKEKLHEKIERRLNQRFKLGMIEEIKNLHKKGLTWKRLKNFGLEYYWISLFLTNKISEEEMKEKLFNAIKDYSKRQMTWFKKDFRIIWASDFSEIEKETKKFLN